MIAAVTRSQKRFNITTNSSTSYHLNSHSKHGIYAHKRLLNFSFNSQHQRANMWMSHKSLYVHPSIKQLLSMPSPLTPNNTATSSNTTTAKSASTAPSKPQKEETAVERALRDIKQKQLDDLIKAYEDPSMATNNTTTSTSSNAVATETQKKKKPSLYERIKEEASHYWHGSKLLGKEIGISFRLMSKLLKGNKLSRREQRQLKRTLGDVARVVPMIVIVAVPFLEFALPVLLKLFPNMLPSTFESKFQEEEKKKKLLKVRLEVAKFLQETVTEMAITGSSTSASAKEFVDFFRKYRASGEQSSTDEIIAIARKFQDKLTLDNLSRPQLVSMCRYMNINAFGTDSFLRSQIENRLRYLKQDDMLIVSEGVDSMNVNELQQACQSRGIRTIGVSPARLRSELQQWLDLHVKNEIPSTLLILSRAFLISDKVPKDSSEALQGSAQALQATLSSLPDQVLNETALQMAEAEGTATAKQKLSVLQEQEELIQDEIEQEEAQQQMKNDKEEEEKEKEASESISAAAATSSAAQQPITDMDGPEVITPAMEQTNKEVDEHITQQQMIQIADAVKTLTSDSALKDVKEKLDHLKEDRKEFIEDIAELKHVTQKEPIKATGKLGQRIDKMIDSIEKELERYDSEIGTKLNVVRPDEEGRLTIQDLEDVLKVLNNHPNDDRIKNIVKKLDKDGDGLVALHEIMDLAEEADKKSEGTGVVLDSSATSSSPASSSNSSKKN